jgi:hypothetical protein
VPSLLAAGLRATSIQDLVKRHWASGRGGAACTPRSANRARHSTSPRSTGTARYIGGGFPWHRSPSHRPVCAARLECLTGSGGRIAGRGHHGCLMANGTLELASHDGDDPPPGRGRPQGASLTRPGVSSPRARRRATRCRRDRGARRYPGQPARAARSPQKVTDDRRGDAGGHRARHPLHPSTDFFFAVILESIEVVPNKARTRTVGETDEDFRIRRPRHRLSNRGIGEDTSPK